MCSLTSSENTVLVRWDWLISVVEYKSFYCSRFIMTKIHLRTRPGLLWVSCLSRGRCACLQQTGSAIVFVSQSRTAGLCSSVCGNTSQHVSSLALPHSNSLSSHGIPLISWATTEPLSTVCQVCVCLHLCTSVFNSSLVVSQTLCSCWIQYKWRPQLSCPRLSFHCRSRPPGSSA